MTVFDRRLSEYLVFMRVYLIAVFVVGLARLGLSLMGVDNAMVKWISISAVGAVAWLYYSVAVHTSGFGSYRHLLAVNVILGFAGNLISAVGIVIAIMTGQDNVFSTPEFSGGADGKTWFHAFQHVVLGTILGGLMFWLLGCVVMFVAKKVAPRPQAVGDGRNKR